MTSPKVGATASLIMFLIVCTGCINKDLVEARKIEVIQQSNEPAYHIDYDGPETHPSPPPNNSEEPAYHIDYDGPETHPCPPPNNSEDMDKFVFHGPEIYPPPPPNSPKGIDVSVSHADYQDSKAAPPSHNNHTDMDESGLSY